MRGFLFAALGAAQALAAAPAFATDPLPGVEIGLGQKPGGIVASAKSDSAGTVSFFNLPAGRYQVFIDNSKLTAPAIAAISVGREAPTLTDPIPVDRTPSRGKTSSRGYGSANGGGALALVLPAGSGAARGAKPLAASGAAPRDANPASTIVVVLTTQ